MVDHLGKEVDRLLREGLSKKKILKKYENSEKLDEVAYLLNEFASLEKRKKFLIPHLILTMVLIAMTGMKLMTAAEVGTVNLVFFLALVIPAINIYVLKKLFRFRRTGYQFLFILSVIALFHSENHHPLEASMLGVMILVSGFLYLNVFPKKDLIKNPASTDRKDD